MYAVTLAGNWRDYFNAIWRPAPSSQPDDQAHTCRIDDLLRDHAALIDLQHPLDLTE
jgi:hypothetical protein